MKTDELMKIVSSYIESSNRSADEMASFLVPYIIASQEHEIRADERERCVQKAENERLSDGTEYDDDVAYNQAIDHVIEAIRKAE